MAQLKALVARVRLFFDKTREPLRRRVYTIVGIALAVGVSMGYLTGDAATSITSLVGALLMIPTTEAARSVVKPAYPVDDTPGAHAAQEVDSQ